MFKKPVVPSALKIGIGSGLVLIFILGSTLLLAKDNGTGQWRVNLPWSNSSAITQKPQDQESVVLSLALVDPQTRLSQLEAISSQSKPSFERNRARFLLATDWLDKLEGGKALRLLEGLEQEYPILAPYIFLKRARGYELTNELDRAKATLLSLIKTYRNSPVVADAYFMLSKYEPQYGDKAIAEFPHHPRTHEIVRQRLEGNPQKLPLLLFLAKNTPDAKGMSDLRDNLVKNFSSQLTPEDWEDIGFGYWEQLEYGKAATAYSKAPRSSISLYRSSRGKEIENNKEEAKRGYLQLIQEFPETEETGKALLRLAAISQPQEAVNYLDTAIAKFPKQAPNALLAKAKNLEKLGNAKAADETRNLIISQYGSSDGAAEYRWEMAKKMSAQGKLVEAWRWAQPIAIESPDNRLAPRAAFWIGKWATRLNRPEDAKLAYQYVLAKHPESYYAWRSAVLLGWNVGDFTSVRDLQPEVITPNRRPLPPAGSEMFKELYQLSQNEEAQTLWEAELGNKRELTVAEQFTQGLVRQAMGQYLKGISSIWELRQRENPEEREQWKTLRQTAEYWQALFPFPYANLILEGSKQYQINPLLVVSLIRQESRFDPQIRSFAGALGLMQVLPDTGKWAAQKINLKEYSLLDPADNIKLGTWYLDHTHAAHQNNSLLAIASYNAGPGNVSKWLKQFKTDDPDVFVERIPFNETKGYIESVFGNYWNYLRLYNPETAKLMNQ